MFNEPRFTWDIYDDDIHTETKSKDLLVSIIMTDAIDHGLVDIKKGAIKTFVIIDREDEPKILIHKGRTYKEIVELLESQDECVLKEMSVKAYVPDLPRELMDFMRRIVRSATFESRENNDRVIRENIEIRILGVSNLVLIHVGTTLEKVIALLTDIHDGNHSIDWKLADIIRPNR